MKWFIAKYLYQIVIGERERQEQFDEQTRLIMAFDRAEALLKAERMATGFHDSFINCSGEQVDWRFVCIKGLREVNAPHDGQELWSELHEPEDVADFVHQALKQKEFLEMGLMDCPVSL